MSTMSTSPMMGGHRDVSEGGSFWSDLGSWALDTLKGIGDRAPVWIESQLALGQQDQLRDPVRGPDVGQTRQSGIQTTSGYVGPGRTVWGLSPIEIGLVGLVAVVGLVLILRR